MSVPLRYVLQQGPVIRALGRAALRTTRGTKHANAAPSAIATPGPELVETLAPRSRELVRAYLAHVGGSPDTYRDTLPAHLFPQWSFALAARALEEIPYSFLRVLNGGCRVEIAAPLPAHEPLRLAVRLEDIDDDGRRAVFHQRIVTGTASVPNAHTAHLYAIVPLGSKKKDGAAPRKEPAMVPADARELERWSLPGNAGLDFAKLTGDVNPVHWVRPYARAFGFKSTILHGYSTMARAWEGIVKHVLRGDPHAMGTFDARFTKPLVLPARVGLYERDGAIFVGEAPGSAAYLTGSFRARGERNHG